MKFGQARGYFLERIIQHLMNKTGCIDVKSGYVEGRGANHQIDSYGVLQYPTLYTYPIRILAEVKCVEVTLFLLLSNF